MEKQKQKQQETLNSEFCERILKLKVLKPLKGFSSKEATAGEIFDKFHLVLSREF